MCSLIAFGMLYVLSAGQLHRIEVAHSEMTCSNFPNLFLFLFCFVFTSSKKVTECTRKAYARQHAKKIQQPTNHGGRARSSTKQNGNDAGVMEAPHLPRMKPGANHWYRHQATSQKSSLRLRYWVDSEDIDLLPHAAATDPPLAKGGSHA